RVHFTDNETNLNGALSDNATLRDHNPNAFLQNLIWNTRGERQCFQFGPADNQAISWRIAKDPNVQVSVISGAWAVPLFKSNKNFANIRKEAARLQKIESDHIGVLQSPWTKARVRVWTMAEFIEAPMEPLQAILDEIGPSTVHRLKEVPKMVDLTGFGQFLQNLKNQGMHPYLMGDFAVNQSPDKSKDQLRKPYLVR
ncbi:MAG: glycosyl transferase, partial [Paracoccaceae bacterium]